METIGAQAIITPPIDPDLFVFAYVPDWYGQLERLADMALPEPWRFRSPSREWRNTDTPILERYINSVYRKLAIDYAYAGSEEEADRMIYARNQFICLHTGLFNRHYKGIYMCLERNKRPDATRKWFLKGFTDENSPWLTYVQPLPSRPVYQSHPAFLNPEWPIRINAEHIIGDPDNIARLPEPMRTSWNLPLLLETSVEFSKRRMLVEPDLIAQQIYQGRAQYLLPIYLTNAIRPDLALAVSVMDGYYLGHTCLTMEMAYQNARLLGRPAASWLRALLE